MQCSAHSGGSAACSTGCSPTSPTFLQSLTSVAVGTAVDVATCSARNCGRQFVWCRPAARCPRFPFSRPVVCWSLAFIGRKHTRSAHSTGRTMALRGAASLALLLLLAAAAGAAHGASYGGSKAGYYHSGGGSGGRGYGGGRSSPPAAGYYAGNHRPGGYYGGMHGASKSSSELHRGSGVVGPG